MPKPTVYLETTIIGWLTNKPSTNIILEAHRQLTHRWWQHRRFDYQLFISQIVLDEISKGDSAAVSQRLALAADIPLLPINQEIASTAADLVRIHALPKKALQDAFHIATAAQHHIDFLVTWNCTHIANPHIMKMVRRFLDLKGLPMPEIATPEAMLGKLP